MVDAQLSPRLEDSIKKSFRSYIAEFEKKAKDERKRYIDLVKKSVKEIIKDEVKNQLLEILPKEVSDYATHVIQSSNTESLKNIILAKSSSQPKSTYEVAASLTEFELKKILLDKIQKSKSYRGTQEYKDLYDALRDREDKDKDEDPPAGSDQGLKKQKTSKDAEPSKGSKSKESKSSSSKGSKFSGQNPSGKSTQQEPVFEFVDTEMTLNHREDLGNTDDQPNVKVASKDDWFKKPKRPLTPDSNWNTTKIIEFRPPQTWISKIAKAGKPPLTFDELMSTPIDFSAYVVNNLKIENLTQEYLVGPAFNLLKGTCKSRVELEYHFEECLQVVPANYFFNNDLEYLKGGSSSRKYTTSTTKTKAAKYDTIEGIEDMVPSLCNIESKHDVFFTKRIIAVTHVKVIKWYDYGYLEEIVVQREDQQLYKFKEGNFPRLNLCDIKDLLLLLVQKKLSNLEKDVIYDLNVALRMFTRRIVILKRVEDLQLGVESYQKNLNPGLRLSGPTLPK
ncbi:hypothetical protein Tco_0092491 [Tanacetum coccineum]